MRWCKVRWRDGASDGAKGATVQLLAAFALALLLIACSADAHNPRTPGPSDAPSQRRTVDTVAPLRFDSSRAWTHLQRQVQFGPRPAGSAALAECRQYIEAQLKANGIAFREQPFDASAIALLDDVQAGWGGRGYQLAGVGSGGGIHILCWCNGDIKHYRRGRPR